MKKVPPIKSMGFTPAGLLFLVVLALHSVLASSEALTCFTCASVNLKDNWHLTSFPRKMDDEYFTTKCDEDANSVKKSEKCSTMCVSLRIQKPVEGGTMDHLYVRGCLDRLLGQRDLNGLYASTCDEGDIYFFDAVKQRIRTTGTVKYCNDKPNCNDGALTCGDSHSSGHTEVSCYDCVNGINCEKESACLGRYCVKTRTLLNDRETVIQTCSAINPIAPLKTFNTTGSACTHYEGKRHIWTRSSSGNVQISSDHCYCTSDFCNGVSLAKPAHVPLVILFAAILYRNCL